MRELSYYVAVTLDGFIAGPNGEYDAFPVEGDHMDAINERFADTVPTDAAAALGLAQDRSTFDTVLMGWNTYAVGLPSGVDSPYRHLRQLVVSREHEATGGGVETVRHDPVGLVRELKTQDGSGIWLCGGGTLAAQLADEIDRLVLKRYPLLFGGGIPLFGPRPYAPVGFTEVSTQVFGNGVVFSEYMRAR